MSRRHLVQFVTNVAVLAVVFSACVDDAASPTAVASEVVSSMSADGLAPAPPMGLVSLGSLEAWPWTGRDFSGGTTDPVNLVFTGDVDIVSLRAALLALDGDRTAYGFPPVFPFDCTWKDAHGEIQTTYSSGAGWVASAVQLECGDYAPVRFHIRLFDAGPVVLGAVHFDLLIPGTPQHQVLAWELPQQFVTVDFLRSGILAAPPAFQPVTPPDGMKTIPKPIYDGIPDELKGALGLPPGPAPGASVPVPNDGVATILAVGSAVPVSADLVEYEISAPFNQVIPRPFCAQGPADFVLVQGPVDIAVRTSVSAQGELAVHNTLRGELDVTPIDISTGLPSGATFRAQISQIDNAGVGPSGTRVEAIQQRKALPPGVGFLRVRLITGPNGLARFTSSETCGGGPS